MSLDSFLFHKFFELLSFLCLIPHPSPFAIVLSFVMTWKSHFVIYKWRLGYRNLLCLCCWHLALLSSLQNVFVIRFMIDREECFSHNVRYEVGTEHLSFIVIKVNGAWHCTQDDVDLVVIFHVSLLKFVGFVKFFSFFAPHLHLITSKYY